MAFANDMTRLVNKMERQLGTRLLNLPEAICKNMWHEIIEEDTMSMFSRYFPLQVLYPLGRSSPATDDGWYFIDEASIGNPKIIGVRDIDWASFRQDTGYLYQEIGGGFVDALSLQGGMSMEDIANVQMRRDLGSLFNSGIYVDFKAPNLIHLTSTLGMDVSKSLKQYHIIVFIQHESLLTINETKMELFERLAKADLATFLYGELKHCEIESAYVNIDLKIGELQDEMSKRDDIINEMKESSVTAANPACPIMMTI